MIAIMITLSAVVFPAAERSVLQEQSDLSVPVEPDSSVVLTTVERPVNTLSSIPYAEAEPAQEKPSPLNNDAVNATCESDLLPCDAAFQDICSGRIAEANRSVPVDTACLEAETSSLNDHSVFSNAPERINETAAYSPRNQTVIPTIDKLIPLQFMTDYTDILTSADERHIYTFSVQERGFLYYSVHHAEIHGFMGWEATLYREYYLNGSDGEIGYMPMNLLKTTALNTTDASPSVGLMPGEYRIVVKTSSGVSSEEYRLQAVFTAALNHEIECNDTKAAYTELYAGIPMIGSASCYTDKQDDDWYLLRVRHNGKAQITFTHAKTNSVSVAWRVVLYDLDGTELYSENSGMNTENIESGEIGIGAGCYFVAVLCRTRSDEDYTLTVKTEADEHFERELNDTPASATPLNMGSMISGCVTSKAGKLDRDFYRVEMTSRGNFSLVFTHPPAALEDDKNGWGIRLLDESGTVLYSMISTWNASLSQMPVMGLEAGVYYVEINSEDMYRSALSYTLVAGGNESSGFEMEPNNSMKTANYIAQGVPITGTIIDSAVPDDDYFAFTLSAYSRVTVVLRHEVLASQRDIFCFSVCDESGEKAPLYSGRSLMKDADGNNVYFVSSNGNQQNVTGYYELSPGNYFIKVTSGHFVESINYSIEFYIN
jgi:hypothetical protein